MSRRRIEAGFNAASSSFSIKEQNTSSQVINGDDSSVSAPLVPKTSNQISFQIPSNTNLPQERSMPLPVAPVSGNPSGLTFKLNCLPSKQASTPGLSLPKKTGSEHAFGMPLNCIKSNSNLVNPEIMRLTAQKDDLRTRLKASSEKSMILESHLQRVTKVANKERCDFAKQLTHAREEIKSMKECETKLRTHISEIKASFDKKVSFESAVKAAMQSKQLVEAQTKLNNVTQKTEVMENQLNDLQKIRDAVVEETRLHQSSKEEHETLITQVDEIKSKLQSEESKLFQATEEMSRIESDLEARKNHSNEINSSIKEGKERLVVCTSELEAAKQEHAIVTKNTKALEADLKLKTAFQPKKLVVHGDDHPSNMLLCVPVDSVCKRVDDMSDSSSGIPNHFEFDAPISLTGHSTQMTSAATDEAGERDVNTEAMLAAIVGDLKEFLAQAKEENENRGLDKGGQAVGAETIVACAA